jgi:probable addiction module antidote protein
MRNKTRPYREALLEALTDPAEAAHYLSAAISDSPEMFLKAFRNVAQARTMTKVAKDAGVTRETLYKATSDEGNPTFDTLLSVLGSLGLKIEFSPTAQIPLSGPIPPPLDMETAGIAPEGQPEKQMIAYLAGQSLSANIACNPLLDAVLAGQRVNQYARSAAMAQTLAVRAA